MTPLRQKLIRQMDLKNLSPHTRRSYLNAVNGIGRENIFYNCDTVQNSQEINNTLGNLTLFMNAGKFVLDIEYPTTTSNIKDAFEQSYSAGFLTYVTTRDLDTITYITNYEPKYT